MGLWTLGDTSLKVWGQTKSLSLWWNWPARQYHLKTSRGEKRPERGNLGGDSRLLSKKRGRSLEKKGRARQASYKGLATLLKSKPNSKFYSADITRFESVSKGT